MPRIAVLSSKAFDIAIENSQTNGNFREDCLFISIFLIKKVKIKFMGFGFINQHLCWHKEELLQIKYKD
jgi:hypothetical protein